MAPVPHFSPYFLDGAEGIAERTCAEAVEVGGGGGGMAGKTVHSGVLHFAVLAGVQHA